MKLNTRGYVEDFIGVFVVVAVVIGFFGLLLALLLLYPSTKRHETLYIKEKAERTIRYNADGSENDYSKLVYTDKGVYINKDSILAWKFNSSDIYNTIEKGKTYDCETGGWRIGFFSAYRNLLSCVEVKRN